MTDPSHYLFWITSRAAGITAMVLASVSVGFGLMMAGRLGQGRAADRRPVHETLSLAVMLAIAVHGLSLLGDSFLRPTLLDVTVPKGQTRTDWSKRPLTREQLDYAADDVWYLGDVANQLSLRLRELGREHWVMEDCRALEDKDLYEPDPAQAWGRLRGIAQLAPAPRARAKTIAVWREKLARARDLPRAWILPDAAIFSVAHGSAPPLNDSLTASLLEALEESSGDVSDQEPSQDARPTPEQKALIERLGKIVDSRAAELNVSAELLAPRGELKSLGMGTRASALRDAHAMTGWRREEIGTRLLEAMG